MIFQLAFGAAALAVMLYFLILTRRAVLQRLFVIVVFGLGIALIAVPDASTWIAHKVGVGRGADLVLYVSVLFLFAMSFHFYLRFRRQEEQMTVLVRAIATGAPVQVDARTSEPLRSST